MRQKLDSGSGNVLHMARAQEHEQRCCKVSPIGSLDPNEQLLGILDLQLCAENRSVSGYNAMRVHLGLWCSYLTTSNASTSTSHPNLLSAKNIIFSSASDDEA
jgi:hypothetical protein